MLIFIFLFVFTFGGFSQKSLVESNNIFTFDIYKATKSDSTNLFISPFSLNIALSAVNEGSKTSTRNELDDLLQIKNIENRDREFSLFLEKTMDLDDPNFRSCMEWSKDTIPVNSLFLANSLWISDDIDVEENFVNNVRQNYNSELFNFSRQNIPLANNELKEWISAKTKNNIPEITGFNNDVKLSIVNAVYFSGVWGSAFDAKKTRKRKFHTVDKKKERIGFMMNRQHYRYFEDAEIQALTLPYTCDQFSMVIILPKKRNGILEVEKKLDIHYLKEIENLGSYAEVIVSLPKFRIESEIYPMEDLEKEGYSVMFSDEADFTGISSVDSLKIGNITHKTFIEVDEEQTEAAAVSKVDIVVTGYGKRDPVPPPPPKVFKADHPFVFLIKDNRTKALLFIGRYVKK